MGKCLIILSEKSCGSSACQCLLTGFEGVNHVRWTTHYEQETLYWTKAASILGLPQVRLVDSGYHMSRRSVLPLSAERATRELRTFLHENVGPHFNSEKEGRDLVFTGWQGLCQACGPIFIEKSPQHLLQWSVLELMLEAVQELPDIQFLFLGLVRHPLDTIYSQFRRWRFPPDAVEAQWRQAYGNLLRLRELAPGQVVIVRYEDMVESVDALAEVLEFCRIDAGAARARSNSLHSQSVGKWRQARMFGHQLEPATIALAQRYGYAEEDLQNQRRPLWPVTREAARLGYVTLRPMRDALAPRLVPVVRALRKLRAR